MTKQAIDIFMVRFRFLEDVFTITHGDITESVPIERIAKQLGINEIEKIKIVKYLLQKGYLQLSSSKTHVRLTPRGESVIERMAEYQKPEPTFSSDPPKKKKINIFISHISEDKDIAFALKQLLESLFQDKIQLFISSDIESIPLGYEWFSRIKTGLLSSDIAIVLISPESLQRPWINFESGAVWIQGKPVIPLCFAGQDQEKLPPPLSQLQAGSADDISLLESLIAQLAQQLHMHPPEIDIQESAFHRLIVEKSDRRYMATITATYEGTGLFYPGEQVKISGCVEGATGYVIMKIFNLNIPEELTEQRRISIEKDGTYNTIIVTESYPSGEYGATIELPTGEWTKLAFQIIEKE